jgi:hypothetical protein
MARAVTPEDKALLLSLKKEQLTVSYITKIFGYTTTKGTGKIREPKIRQNYLLHLEAGEYINKTAIDTNAGIFLFNKLLIEDKIDKIVPNGFYNSVITKKTFEALMDMVSKAIMDEKIDIPTAVKFLTAAEFYGLKPCAAFSPSFTQNILKPNKDVIKEKDAALKEIGDHPNLKTMVETEDKLVDLAREKNKADPGMTLYTSGSRGEFSNDYKNISIMIGPTMNPQTGKFDFMKSNFMDGLKKEDIYKAGNSVVSASYPKAVGTAVSGYMTKQFYSVYQSIVTDLTDSDCGSVGYLDVYLTKENADFYMYQYVKLPKGKLECLEPETVSKYYNTNVKLRSPMYCTSYRICHACMGDRFKRLGIENAGLTTVKISNTLLNLGMKNFHVTKVKMNEVDPNKLLL